MSKNYRYIIKLQQKYTFKNNFHKTSSAEDLIEDIKTQ